MTHRPCLPIASSINHIKSASDELVCYMTDMILSRRAELSTGEAEQRHDLFNQLIENSGREFAVAEKSDRGLTDEELIG
jgi:hypothetical protein